MSPVYVIGGLLMPHRLIGTFGGGVTATGGWEAALRISSLLREPNEIAWRPLKSVRGGEAERDGDGIAGNASGTVNGASDKVDGPLGDGSD